MSHRVSRVMRGIAAYLGFAVAAAVIIAPVALEQAVEHASFDDRLGTFPVEVSLSRNGVSTLETGILGKVYWERTGTAGFGASIVSAGPPLAEGTLSSYVSPEFLRRNTEFINDPDLVASAYGDELSRLVVRSFIRFEVVGACVGGLLLMAVFRGALPAVPRRLRRPWGRALLRTGYVVAALLAAGAIAATLFGRWDGRQPPGTSYPMPESPEVSFSSRQTLEVARQVQPFIEKNSERIEKRTSAYVTAAGIGIATALPVQASGLVPRDNEIVVIAEADPQGSLVGTRVRRLLYRQLEELVGDDAIRLRTISGDLTSNGTVAEREFVQLEAEASPGVPTIAVKGDHDTEVTVEQMKDNGLVAPDLETVDAGGLNVAGAGDPAFKALFGGLVENPTGVTEEDLGRELRDVVAPDRPVIVLLHQPRAALGYLGLDTISTLATSLGHETTPYDDGIPDLPPGVVNIGHLHDRGGPWVVWNTDGDEISWTVVNQLGTSGGVEETPTFNRFSTPFSVPLKAVSVQLQYLNPDTGLQTGYVSIAIQPDGAVSVEDRVDLGLPAGEPG